MQVTSQDKHAGQPRGTGPAGLPLAIIAFAVVLTGLIVGSGFLIPVLIAFLLANLLETYIARMERVGVPTVLAYLIAIASALAIILLVAFILAAQADAVMSALPRYQARLQNIIADVFAWMGPHAAERVKAAFVEINFSQQIKTLLGSAGALVLNALLVILYAAFLLAERGRFSKKLLSLAANRPERVEIEEILARIWSGISQYLWIKTLMSLLTGLISYGVLKFFGVDFAETWGLVIAFLNYIPSIGSALGVLFPAMIAFVQFETLWQPTVVVAILAVVQLTIGNILEPQLMGRSLNLSPFIVIVSLVFWGLIWGVPGAFLSVPIMVGLLIVCAHVPELRWIAVLLSKKGRLASTGAPTPGKPKSKPASATPGKPGHEDD